MPKINVISDLHLEFADLYLPGGDILILSGDVCEAKNLKPDSKYTRFFQEECTKYRHVIYVMGNHEHYGFKFNKTYEQIKSFLPANIHLLEKESVVLDDILFVGGTLWTDCNGRDPITAYTLRQNMNDYRVIGNLYSDGYRKLTPEFTVQEHVKTKNYISKCAKEAGDRPVVVVTHHSPSTQSIKPKYQDDYHMNGGYSSRLEDFILDHPNIKYWTHGHTHDTFDYMIGDCRVICNPRGYSGYEMRAKEFDPTVSFNI